MLKKQFFLLAILFIGLYSCKDPDSIVGLSVQPTVDKLGLSIDTATLQTSVVTDTVLRSDKVLSLLGSEYSAVYGKTNASIYSQVIFGTTPAFGQASDTLYADSLVLRLAYSSFYGDTTTALRVHVYNLAAGLNVDSPYYSNSTIPTDSELAVLDFSPQPTTYLTEFGSPIAPQLRIRLDSLLAAAIISKNLQPELSSNDQWLNYFKGLYIRVDQVTTQGTGCISYFNLSSTDSKMTLYFHRGTLGDDSLYYDFQFSGARFNHQEHDFSTAVFASHFNDTTQAVDYIQGASGVKVKINIPWLTQFAYKSNIAINRAQLIIKRVQTPADTLSPPPSLWVQMMDSVGNPLYILDQFESTAYYGGTYDATAGQYSFNITHYVQDVIKGGIVDHGLYLGVSGAGLLQYYGTIQANHVAVGSGNHAADPATKMTLKLYYTKLN